VDERPDRPGRGALPAPEGLLRGDRAPTLASRLDAWVADTRVEGSADARARERWLRAAAEADGTFAGVLLDLAERRTTIAVRTTAGRRHRGGVEVLGADFLALQTADGAEVLLALAGIASVRTAPLEQLALGERVVTTELRLTEVLAQLAAERARVRLVSVDGGDAVIGEVRAVGYDLVTVRTDADPHTTAYVPAAAITEVVVA
jgi:hypothetical protein